MRANEAFRFATLFCSRIRRRSPTHVRQLDMHEWLPTLHFG